MGTWPLNACPMDGGAVAIGPDGAAATFRQRGGKMYECAPGGVEHVVGAGIQGWMARNAAGACLVWLERRGGTLMAQLPGGPAAALSAGADDPMIACAPDGSGPIVAVWKTTKDGDSGILNAVLSQPVPKQ